MSMHSSEMAILAVWWRRRLRRSLRMLSPFRRSSACPQPDLHHSIR
jgi:hypothetical protein